MSPDHGRHRKNLKNLRKLALRWAAKRGSVDPRVNRVESSRKEKTMTVNVAREAVALQRLTVPQLRQRYAEVYNETTNAGNRAWLIKRILWRLQALAEGDLSERARRRAAELANDADLRLNPPKAARNCAERGPLPAPAGYADSRLPPPG